MGLFCVCVFLLFFFGGGPQLCTLYLLNNGKLERVRNLFDCILAAFEKPLRCDFLFHKTKGYTFVGNHYFLHRVSNKIGYSKIMTGYYNLKYMLTII